MFRTSTTARNVLKTARYQVPRTQPTHARSFRLPGMLFPFFDSNANIATKQKAKLEAHAKIMAAKQSNPVYYYHVREGEGGVIELPKVVKELGMTAQEVNAVGTAGCRFCACIYVPLDDHHCFLTHIKAWIDSAIPALAPDHVAASWAVRNKDIGEKLVEYILEKLRADASLKEFVHRHPQHKTQSIIACPQRIWLLGEEKTTGYYVVRALQQYFDLDDSHVQGIDIHGYGIDRHTGERELFTRPRKDAFWHEFEPVHPSAFGWMRVNPELDSETDGTHPAHKKQKWHFVYYDRRWMTYGEYERFKKIQFETHPMANL